MNGWRVVVFEPVDVVASTDPRGLDEGGTTRSSGLSPLTLAGAVRAALLRAAGVPLPLPDEKKLTEEQRKWARALGLYPEEDMTFRFAGPLLYHNGSLFFPAPLHVLRRGGSHALDTPAELLERDGSWAADAGLGGLGLLAPPEAAPDAEPPDGLWVAGRVLRGLLSAGGRPAWRRASPFDAFFAGELRHGHGRHPVTRTVDEGRLFSRACLRPRGESQSGDPFVNVPCYAGLVRGVPEDLLPAQAVIARLGGDGHLARLRVLTQKESSRLLDPLEKLRNDVLKAVKRPSRTRPLAVYLATPSVARAGWMPGGLAAAGVRAAAVGRPEALSGWDLQKGGPRPVRRAVPAGSVYCCHVDPACAAGFVERWFLNEPLTDGYAGLGPGLSAVGLWPGGGARGGGS